MKCKNRSMVAGDRVAQIAALLLLLCSTAHHAITPNLSGRGCSLLVRIETPFHDMEKTMG